MKKYKVTKTIEFCYGHRLLNHKGKCKNLHGHNAKLEVDFQSDRLDQNGMVVDFQDIHTAVKNWVEEHLDHKMILCKHDPIIKVLKDAKEPYYVMEDNPTAENISKLIFNELQKMGFSPSETRIWETPSSSASYRMRNE